MKKTGISSVANPKGQKIIDFSNLKIKPPYTASNLTLLQYITAHQVWLVFVGLLCTENVIN